MANLFADVRVSDEICVCSTSSYGTYYSIATVIKVTPQRFATEKCIYRKDDGRAIGVDSIWHYYYARPLNDETRAMIAHSEDMRKTDTLARGLSDHIYRMREDITCLPLLERIRAILNESTKEVTK